MLNRSRLALGRRLLAARVGQTPVAIVANNCWGAEVYRDLGRPYNTPFVGLFVRNFASLVEGFDELRTQPLSFIETSRFDLHNEARARAGRYPLAVLGDSEIHFVHYATEAEALAKWERRMARLPPTDAVTFVMLASAATPEADMRRFAAAPGGRKALFVPVPPSGGVGMEWHRLPPGDGVTAYNRQHRSFDLAGWLSGGSGLPSGIRSSARHLLVR